MYTENKAVGMEASSAIPVIILDVQPHDKILDLCCARGMKLMLAAEIMSSKRESENINQDESNKGLIIGNDYSKIRLDQTKSILKNFKTIDNLRLIQ